MLQGVAERPSLAATTSMPAVAIPVAVAMPTPVAAMTIPASIPPYRPLRPTPIVSPAMRTPLYIPPIPAPAAEMAVEEEGVIEPMLVDTAEIPVPSAEFSSPAAPTPVKELPWIDAFLAATPPLPMLSIPTPAGDLLPAIEEFHADEVESAEIVEVAADAVAFEDELHVAEAATLAELAGVGSETEESVVDEWPLDEAAQEFDALRPLLSADEVDAAGEPSAPFPELSPWSDDDLMDIMPIQHSGKTPLSSAAVPSDGELWADRARKAHEEAQVFRAMASAKPDTREPREESAAESTAEEAAHALELLAQRVRAGELMLPTYDPRMGEPAALVAALAALLGVRLR